MPGCSEKCGLLCGICRIGCFTMYECCCCVKPPPELPSYNTICIGLTNAGKTSILNAVTFSNNDVVIPTVGGDNIRPYWDKYFANVHAVIFVIDVTNHAGAKTTLQQVLKDDKLKRKPWLVLLNKTDLADDCNANKIIEEFELKDNETVEVQTCSKDNEERLLSIFERFVLTITDFYSLSESSDRL